MIHRVLVVDEDPWTPPQIAAALADLPLEIHSATDGTIAMAKVLASPPDLIISSVEMQGMDGWALVRRLRARPELAFIPFIFLSAAPSLAEVLRGFRLGADDFVAKPFAGPELQDRVHAALTARDRLLATAREALADRAEPALQSSLGDFGLASLLVLLEMDRKTGRLELTRSAPEERCSIAVRDGRVIAAASDPRLVNAQAVFHALSWVQGSIRFVSGPVDAPDEIQMTTMHLLMEGAQRLDEVLRPAPIVVDAMADDLSSLA